MKEDQNINERVKAWKISNDEMCGGFIIEDISFFEEIMITELEESDSEYYYTKEEIAPFIEKVRALEVGQTVQLYPWTATCIETTRSEYESLPEFDGW